MCLQRASTSLLLQRCWRVLDTAEADEAAGDIPRARGCRDGVPNGRFLRLLSAVTKRV